MKIYIAEDNSFIKTLLNFYISKMDLKIVGEASDGKIAYKDILKKQPDIVAVDLAMPGMSGAEIVEKIGQEFPQIKFLIVTALDQDFVYNKYPFLEEYLYLRKPFKSKDLEAKVNELVELKHGQAHG